MLFARKWWRAECPLADSRWRTAALQRQRRLPGGSRWDSLFEGRWPVEVEPLQYLLRLGVQLSNQVLAVSAEAWISYWAASSLFQGDTRTLCAFQIVCWSFDFAVKKWSFVDCIYSTASGWHVRDQIGAWVSLSRHATNQRCSSWIAELDQSTGEKILVANSWIH